VTKISPKVFFFNVRNKREKLGISQAELANLLEINPKSYNVKERGLVARVESELAEKIAKALNSTVEELSQGEVPDIPLVKPDVAIFWTNCKLRREEIGLSQAEIAQRLQMSSQNYQTKEALRSPKLSQDLKESVALALETTVEELMRTEDEVTVSKEETKADTFKMDAEVKQETSSKVSGEYNCISHFDGVTRRILLDPKNKEKIEEAIYEYFFNR